MSQGFEELGLGHQRSPGLSVPPAFFFSCRSVSSEIFPATASARRRPVSFSRRTVPIAAQPHAFATSVTTIEATGLALYFSVARAAQRLSHPSTAIVG